MAKAEIQFGELGGGYSPFEQSIKNVLNGTNTYTFSDFTTIKAVFVAYQNVATFAYKDGSDALVVDSYYPSNWKVTAISGNTVTLFSSYVSTNTQNIKFYIQGS